MSLVLSFFDLRSTCSTQQILYTMYLEQMQRAEDFHIQILEKYNR